MTRTTKTTTDRFVRSQRRPLLGAVVAFALVLAACSSGEDATLEATTTAQLPSQTTTAPQSNAVLQSALARYDAGYEFSSQVVVNGEIALDVEGRHVSGRTQMTINSGEGEVEYLIIGGSQWARTPGGDWDVVSEGEASQPPLLPLKSPTAADVVADNSSEVVVEATYPASAFGIAGDDLQVTLTIEGERMAKAEYVSVQDGATATVTTTFRPLSDFTPITAP
jgi:hypothetical protein